VENLPTFWRYWKRFLARLWKDAVPWARDNILWAVAVLVIPPVVARLLYKNSVDWQFIRLTLYLYGIVFGAYLVLHFVRTPWKLDTERQQESSASQVALKESQAKIEELAWPLDHPIIRFVAWGENPTQNPFNQRGFLLRNSGGVSLEVRVEEFKVGTNAWTGSIVPGIERDETQFALVWMGSGNPFEKFDLLLAMQNQAGPAGLYAPDLSVPVSVVYRDARNNWYRGRADLTFIRSQHQLNFGPTTCEKLPVPPQQKWQ
jgi:hypothetical protein